MKLKLSWQTITVVVSLILNLVLVGIFFIMPVLAAPPTVSLPNLPKGSGYVVSISNLKTIAEIETYMGLPAGSIESMTTDPWGGLTIRFAKDVGLSQSQAQYFNDIGNKLTKKIETVVK